MKPMRGVIIKETSEGYHVEPDAGYEPANCTVIPDMDFAERFEFQIAFQKWCIEEGHGVPNAALFVTYITTTMKEKKS